MGEKDLLFKNKHKHLLSFYWAKILHLYDIHYKLKDYYKRCGFPYLLSDHWKNIIKKEGERFF